MEKEIGNRFLDFVSNYKKLIREDRNEPEIYKWECVFHFQKTFDIDAPEFERMLRDSMKKVVNLIYVNSLGFILRAAKHFPEEVRAMFRELYNEDKDIQLRIEAFQNAAKELLPHVIEKHGKPLNDQQDERTISFYLAMIYPDKYPLYKDDIYKLLLEVFPNESLQKAGKKYIHFIELSKNLIPVIEADEELIQLSKATLNADSYTGNQSQLIFQDILWRNRHGKNNTEKVSYYLVGAYWDREDQTERFLKKGFWENGYGDKFMEVTNSIEPGSRIAIKAVHTEAKTKSVMTIKAIGTVTNNHEDGRLLDVEWDTDVTPFKVDFSGGYWSTVHLVENTEHINAIFFRKTTEPIINTIKMTAHNIILYGPPGTGKTYNSIDKAVEIATGKSFGNHFANKREFDRLRMEGQIEFVTFHQNYSYEDFIVGLKPDAEFENLRFKSYKGIFYEMARKARENYLASKEKRSIELDFDAAFNSIVQPLSEGKEVEIKMKSGISFWIYDLTTASIMFRKQTGSTIHSLSIDSLKEIVEEGRKTPAGLEPYYTPLVNLIKEQKVQPKNSTVEVRKDFVLIIDEINRANISRVFGELITLLEDDKRIGEPNELRITLPNGEKDFGIPPNLYLIGTMNTADKSIALVDIALRRRFEFIGYYPDYRLPGLSETKVSLLRHINKVIYGKKKSADYLIGHAYFLNNTDIEIVLRNKVIPLFMEYFSGKSDIVAEIFTGSNWKVNFNEDSFAWDIQNLNTE